MAFVSLGVSVTYLAIMLPSAPIERPRARQIIDSTALRDLAFINFALGGFPVLIGYFAPLVYLPTFIESQVHLHNSADLAFYMLAATNGVSTFSRIGGGFLAARFGPCGTYTVALTASAALLFGWIGVHNLGGLIIWTVLWGLTTGLIISLPGTIAPLMCPDASLLGTRIGMTYTPAAFGILVGSPIGGKLITGSASGGPTWWHFQVFTAFAMILGVLSNGYTWYHVSWRSG
ncbi:MAG: hypothetical protein Q9162_003516 [Coniocarpon cinnabarinum]